MTELQLNALGLTLSDWDSFGIDEKLYLDLSQLLSGIEDLRWIDLEAGQLEAPLENYPVQFPCALIDFPNTDFQDEGYGNQQALVTVQLRVAVDVYEDSQVIDGTSTPDRGKAVKRLNIPTQIHQLLHGFETDYSNPLVRMNRQTERRDDLLKVFTVTYGCAAKDSIAAKVFNQYTGAALEVDRG
jgi:hypothetical protein